tara:strand:- start:208 stop:720 length:513 start_codon:yes stop_codon:yes gene_type:complete
MITYKTLNKDNPRLNCRLRGLENFSPKRIILDSELNSKINSYIIRSSKNINTLIFYNNADKSKISKFKKKGVILIKSKIDKSKRFNIKEILKKLYKYGCRNLLIEGGNDLTSSLIKNKVFNKFYLFKSPKNLPKTSEYLKFKCLKALNRKYKKRINLNLNLRKDKITLYR